MNCPEDLAATRREFLRRVARLATLTGLTAGVVYVIRSRRPDASAAVCIRNGLCNGCGRFPVCSLPPAASRRSASPGGPS